MVVSLTNTGGNSSQKTDNAPTSGAYVASVISCSKNDPVFMASLSAVVKDVIFPIKQFIVLEQELDVQGKLARKCLKAIDME